MLNSSTDVPYASGPSTRYHSAVSLTNLEPSRDQVARHPILCGFKGMSSLREPGVELRPAAKSIPQDWASLARYLARSGTILGPAPPQQFAGGFGNLNYLIELDGKPVVLRRPPSGALPPEPMTWRANTASCHRCGGLIRWRPGACSTALSRACWAPHFRSSSTARGSSSATLCRPVWPAARRSARL